VGCRARGAECVGLTLWELAFSVSCVGSGFTDQGFGFRVENSEFEVLDYGL